jgi:hypothetical protein
MQRASWSVPSYVVGAPGSLSARESAAIPHRRTSRLWHPTYCGEAGRRPGLVGNRAPVPPRAHCSISLEENTQTTPRSGGVGGGGQGASPDRGTASMFLSAVTCHRFRSRPSSRGRLPLIRELPRGETRVASLWRVALVEPSHSTRTKAVTSPRTPKALDWHLESHWWYTLGHRDKRPGARRGDHAGRDVGWRFSLSTSACLGA